MIIKCIAYKKTTNSTESFQHKTVNMYDQKNIGSKNLTIKICI